MKRVFPALFLALLLLLPGGTAAQPGTADAVRIGILLPSERGEDVEAYLAVRAAERVLLPALRGMEIELVFAEGGSGRLDTSTGLRELIASEVHAVICCQTGESAAAANEFAGQLPILTLVTLSADEAEESRLLPMRPGELATGRALALAAWEV